MSLLPRLLSPQLLSRSFCPHHTAEPTATGALRLSQGDPFPRLSAALGTVEFPPQRELSPCSGAQMTHLPVPPAACSPPAPLPLLLHRRLPGLSLRSPCPLIHPGPLMPTFLCPSSDLPFPTDTRVDVLEALHAVVLTLELLLLHACNQLFSSCEPLSGMALPSALWPNLEPQGSASVPRPLPSPPG